MMVTVLVTQTVNWVKLYLIVLVVFVCFVYGGILDTINRVSVVCIHGSHPLSCPGAVSTGYFFVCLPCLRH